MLLVDGRHDDGEEDASRRDVVQDLAGGNFRIGEENVNSKTNVLQSRLDGLGVETLLLVDAHDLAVVPHAVVVSAKTTAAVEVTTVAETASATAASAAPATSAPAFLLLF